MKAPGFFKKNLTELQLRIKYLKYIEQTDDKTFIRSCYDADGELLVIKKDFGEAEIKRLKELKKAIKGNRGLAVKLFPLFLVTAFIAGLVFFFTVLANPLLRRATEAGLEAIFEAKVDAEGFRVSLFNFEIAMNSLTIADRDRPMRNLIEFSSMRIKLRPEAVLRGKVYIEEIRADNIHFATERSVSGALPDRPPRERASREEISIPPLVDLQNFDPIALLNQEFDKLLTPALYNSAIESYNDAMARWSAEEQAARARVIEIQAHAEPLLAINANDFRNLDVNTINQIRTIISDVNIMINTVQAAQDDIDRIFTGVEADINSARALEQNARNAFNEDLGRLRSYLDPGSDAVAEVLSSIVWSILTDTAEVYIEYAQRAMEVLEKIKDMQAMLPQSSPRPPRAEVFRGRDVIFPTPRYPRFYLGVLATDFLTPSAWHWGFDLRSVSSFPDAYGAPTSLVLTLDETNGGIRRSADFRGQADFSSNASERFNAEFSGAGFPVDLRAGLDNIGIGGFSGGASFTASASGNISGGFSAGGGVSLVQASLRNPANTFAQAADEAIRSVGSVDFGMNYTRVADGRDQFSLNTNFGSILQDAMTRIVTQYIRQAEAALERAFRARIEQYIDGRFLGREDLDAVFRAVRGDRDAVAQLKNSLENKQAELENRIRTGVSGAADQAQEQAQQAVQDIIQGRTPTAPSLPSLPGSLRR